jgi:hypothetical protein
MNVYVDIFVVFPIMQVAKAWEARVQNWIEKNERKQRT